MEWAKFIIEVFVGLGFLGVTFKWIFSPRFRLELTKKNFEKDKLEIDNYLDSCDQFNRNLIHPVQFQYATNIFLGTTKFHYSLFNERIKNLWNFKKVFSELNYSYSFIKQVVVNNQAHLKYVFKEKTIKNIRLVAVIIFFLAVLVYLGVVIFEIFFLNEFLSSQQINKNDYTFYKLFLTVLYVILILMASFFGGKASVALSLKDTLDIREKNDEN